MDRAVSNATSVWSRVLDRFGSYQGGFGDPLSGGYGGGFGDPLAGQSGGGLGDPLSGSYYQGGFGDPLGGYSGGGFGDPLAGQFSQIGDPLAGWQPNRFAQVELNQLGQERRAAEQANQPPSAANSGIPPGKAGQGRGLDGTWQWKTMIDQAASEAGIPAEVIQAIMGIESGGNAGSISVAGATGLMQVMPNFWQGTANKYGGNLMDPWVNIRTAADILKQNFDRYGSWDKAAAAYLGAIDDNGNITGAPDAYGTTGYLYVDLFNQNLYVLQQPSAPAGGAAGSGSVVFPVQGYQGDLSLHWGEHPGAIDLFADYGTPVLAMMGGTASSGYTEIGGYWTLITGDDGLQYYYAHMDKMGPNGRVETGSYIAGVSDTGNAKGTGPHLHLGIGSDIYSGAGPAGGAGDANVISILENAYRY